MKGFRRAYWKGFEIEKKRASVSPGLDPYTEYAFRLRAANAAGRSAWSDVARVRTASGPPSAPLTPIAEGAASLPAALPQWPQTSSRRARLVAPHRQSTSPDGCDCRQHSVFSGQLASLALC